MDKPTSLQIEMLCYVAGQVGNWEAKSGSFIARQEVSSNGQEFQEDLYREQEKL